MTTRVFVMLIAGVIISAALTFGLAFSERQRVINQVRESHAAERLAQFVLSIDTIPAHLRDPVLKATAGLGVRAEPASATDEAIEPRSSLANQIDERLPDGYRIASVPATDCAPPPGASRWASARPPKCEAVVVTLHDGSRLRLTLRPPRPPVSPLHVDQEYAILFLLSIGLLAAVVARMTMRPLKRLAQAATELGNDIERAPLAERGAIEIRQAAAAFNAMQARIRRHIQQRGHILAAITHDLQTPLTRLRLRLEKVDDADLRDKLLKDLSAMQGMVREGLDLARSMDSAEPVQRLDLDSLIDSVCDDAADGGQAVSCSGKLGSFITARPLALRRCLTNLIDNAVKYGSVAHLHVAREGAFAVIRIKDEGQGIPADQIDKVFDPFYRVESSRSRDTGGTGLGLTIARNIAEQHNGAIQLRNCPGGGLEVTLSLPCALTTPHNKRANSALS